MGISAAGVTVNELPKTKQTSANSECKKPSSRGFSGKFSLKLIILSWSSPLQA